MFRRCLHRCEFPQRPVVPIVAKSKPVGKKPAKEHDDTAEYRAAVWLDALEDVDATATNDDDGTNPNNHNNNYEEEYDELEELNKNQKRRGRGGRLSVTDDSKTSCESRLRSRPRHVITEVC